MPAEHKQFRKVGPMTLPSATQEDLQVLRDTIVRSASIVKYIAFFRPDDGTADYLVFAHANNKLTAACWRGAIHSRLTNITPVADLRDAIEHAQKHATFEQFGEFNTRSRSFDKKLATPIAKKSDTPPAEKPMSYVQRLIGHIKPKNGTLLARKEYLKILGVQVPNDYESSFERAREIELALQGKSPEKEPAVSSKQTSAPPNAGHARKFMRKFKYAPVS